MSLLTTNAGGILRPEEVGNLIVQPVEKASVAMQIATIVPTNSKDFRIPIVTDDVSAAWTAEGQDITPADAEVAQHGGAFDAQTIFAEQVPVGALDIEIFRADHTAYSKKLDRVVMMREAPDHAKEDFVLLSGTKVREMLGKGMAPPPEFSRPEVAKVLMDYYQSIQ